jgi:hypothetical protein
VGQEREGGLGGGVAEGGGGVGADGKGGVVNPWRVSCKGFGRV